MVDVSQLEHEMSEALSEPSVIQARYRLHKAIRGAQEICDPGPDLEHTRRLCSVAYGHLANMADKPAERTRYRARSLATCTNGLARMPDSSMMMATYANAVADWFYDSFTPVDRLRLQAALSRARAGCQELLKKEKSSEARVHLLVQCASVLRCQAKLHGANGGPELSQKALRTSQAACREDVKSGLVHLDLGQSQFAVARWANSEEEHFSLIRDAEYSFVRSHELGLPLASVALARLHRHTYRPAQALSWFTIFAQREKSRRVVQTNCHIAGESALMLLHRGTDPQLLKERLIEIEQLLSEALQGGYRDARLLVSLSRIRFALGDEVGGLGFLQDLARAGCANWTLAIERARQAIESSDLELLLTAFALGLNDGLVWNSLGTLAKEVLDNPEFALRLYEVGLRLSPHSAVIHTNLARLHIQSGETALLVKAKRHLDAASRYADCSFRWWKPLYDEVERKLSERKVSLRGYRLYSREDSLDRIYREFIVLDSHGNDPVTRGMKLQDLILRMLKFTYGTERVAGDLNLDGVQSDATFKHGSWYYRVEISWDSRPNDRSEVDKLITRLGRTTATRGLLISLSGFTSGVFEEIHRQKSNFTILLMNREEFLAVMRGDVRFESLIETKESQCFLTGAEQS